MDEDTLDGRRCVLRFRAPGAGTARVAATVSQHAGSRPPPGRPPPRPVPLVGAGEALSLGATDATGDLHVGLQTVVDAVDWYGRGRLDLLLCCLGHEGGAFLYGALDGDPRPARSSAAPGGCRASATTRRATPARCARWTSARDGRFDLLECRGSRILWHRNTRRPGQAVVRPAPAPATRGASPSTSAPAPRWCAPSGLGDGRVSLIVGTNDWSDYWPADVGAWEDQPGYRPYDAHGAWRGGPMHGRLYLLRNTGAPEEPRTSPRAGPPGGPTFAAPVELCHEDGTPLEVYGLAGPAAVPGGARARARRSTWWWPTSSTACGTSAAPGRPARTAYPASRRARRCAPPASRRRRSTARPSSRPRRSTTPRSSACLTSWCCRPACTPSPTSSGRRRRAVAPPCWSPPRTATSAPCAGPGAPPRACRSSGPPERIQEVGARLSVGAKACPNVVDWDGDGLDDLVLGNAAGQVLLCRNRGTPDGPVFDPPAAALTPAGAPCG